MQNLEFVTQIGSWDISAKISLMLTNLCWYLVLRDCYQKQEKKQVRFMNIVTILNTCLLIFLSFVALIPEVNSYYTEIMEQFMRTVSMLFALKYLLPTYFEFFSILIKRRKYEFKKFHGSHEIPLAIVILVCLIWHIYWGLVGLYLWCFGLSQFYIFE